MLWRCCQVLYSGSKVYSVKDSISVPYVIEVEPAVQCEANSAEYYKQTNCIEVVLRTVRIYISFEEFSDEPRSDCKTRVLQRESDSECCSKNLRLDHVRDCGEQNGCIDRIPKPKKNQR